MFSNPRVTMKPISDWLDDLERHQYDYEWLAQHFDEIIASLADGLQREQYAIDAIYALNIIFNYVLTRDDYKILEPLLLDALGHAQVLKDDELQTQVWAQLGHNFLLYGLRDQADSAFNSAAYHQYRVTPDSELLFQIGLLKSRALSYEVNDDFVFLVLEKAAQVKDKMLVAALYHALAMAYLYRGENERALGYGQTAYGWWYQTQNHVELANTASTLAEAYRKSGLFNHAERWLNISRQHFERTDHHHKFARYAYQQGVLELQNKQLDRAKHWLTNALERFELLDYPHLTGACHHSLGLTLMHLGERDTARQHMKLAFRAWEKLDLWPEKANISSALGYLSYKEGDYKRALRWYQAALEQIKKAPDAPARETLQGEIEDNIAELKRLLSASSGA